MMGLTFQAATFDVCVVNDRNIKRKHVMRDCMNEKGDDDDDVWVENPINQGELEWQWGIHLLTLWSFILVG